MLRVRAKGVTGWSLCAGPVQVQFGIQNLYYKKDFWGEIPSPFVNYSK
mgnify:CR=1 FL=1